VKTWPVAIGAVLAIAGAHFAGGAAASARGKDAIEEPYAPSAGAAPFVSLGYRELAADVMWVRLLGYFGGDGATADGIGRVVDAIVALDPHYHRIYEYGARAITMASSGVTQQAYLHAIEVLERGMKIFRDDWRLPDLAGEIYTQDLVTKDPAQRRAWDERGTLLVEEALRKPGAPPDAATWAAKMRTKLGQQQLAIANLREMILLTSDPDARQRMIDRLATMVDANKDAIANELTEMQHRFISAWRRDRPDVPPWLYILIGPRIAPAFDLNDLATGGRDLVGAARDDEPLDPPAD
jgi:hypothetical protein